MTKKKTTWLNYFALSSSYERKARLLPALTSFLPLLPLTLSLGGSLLEWTVALAGTTGIYALGAVALAYFASALGNRIQKKLWPDWPFDAPTNVRLMPDNPDTSPQQRAQWYDQIKKLTGLDLQAEADRGDAVAIRATVNDAIERTRNHFRRGKSRARLEQESIHYGYARNLAGMWPVWLGLSVLSCLGSWAAHIWSSADMFWTIAATIVPVPLFFVAFLVLPDFVRTRGRYYCEVFFRLLQEEAQSLETYAETSE